MQVALSTAEDRASSTPGAGAELRDILVARGWVTAEEWEAVAHSERHVAPEQILVDKGRLTPVQIAQARAIRWRCDYRRLQPAPDPALSDCLPARVRELWAIAVLERTRECLVVAVADPEPVALRDALRNAAYPRQLVLVVAPTTDLPMRGVADGERWAEEPSEEEAQLGTEPAVVRLVDDIISRAIQIGASDIHVGHFGHAVEARYRIDSQLQRGLTIPARELAGLISRLKILARLDIAQHRMPQSGEIPWPNRERRQYDLRIETSPHTRGEYAVVRIFGQATQTTIESLGFTDDIQAGLERVFRLPYGLVLLTGPTGSGKSTTLMTLVRRIREHRPGASIFTVEDPVEQDVSGILQVAVDAKAQRTFPVMLRSLLRSDPDVLVIGEIRDSETAQIAVQAALTGHLVLGTLHTNDAPGAVARLINLGVEPHLVAEVLRAVFAQRLVRTVCSACGVPISIPEDARRQLPGLPDTERRGRGCAACYNGYRGRTGIGELLFLTPAISTRITGAITAVEIRQLAHLPTLLENGVRQIVRGRTTVDEVRLVAWTPYEPNGHTGAAGSAQAGAHDVLPDVTAISGP